MAKKKSNARGSSSRDMVPGLGAAMRAVREREGLTLADVAGWIGTGVAALSKVELEQRSPSARFLIEWARAVGVSLDELVAGLDAKGPRKP